MNPTLERWMAEASRLTRAGNLKEATAAIQTALGRRPASPAPAVAPAAPVASAHTAEADVLDVETREVGPAAPARDQAPQAAPGGEFISGHFGNAGGARDYKLFLPPGREGRALPLVVMLHGCTQDPDDFAAGTRMNAAALELGLCVLYPAQAQSANPSRCWNWFKHNHQQRGRGEPAILAGMVQDVTARYNIDPRHVYVAGLSAGGAMAAILGDAYPDIFAAVGVHSGLPTGAASDVGSAFSAMQGAAAAPGASSARTPTIVFHGDQDNTVHPVNGERVVAASNAGATATVERLQAGKGRQSTRHTYRDRRGHVVAEHWVLHGAGHAWAGGSAAGSYTDADGPDATQEMLRFFLANALPAVR